MKKYLFLSIFWIFAAAISFTAPSCKAKYGCPSNEQVQPKVNKKGELKMNRRSGRHAELFDKKRRKRMK